MRPFHPFFCIIILPILIFFTSEVNAQTNNPCGVKAKIWPSSADSVVVSGTVIPFTSTSVNATSLQWLLNGLPSGITDELFNYQISTGQHVISLVAYNGNCADTTTVVYFAPGTAHDLDSLMIGSYGTSRYNEEGICLDKTPDSGFITGGVQYLWDACGQAGILVKTRNKGCIDWSKKFLSPYYCNNSKVTAVCVSSDSCYYAVTENAELAKLDKDGNLLWNKRLTLNNQGFLSVPNVYSGANGAVYTITQAYNNGWTITKLDKNGNVMWNKFFRLSGNDWSGQGQAEYSIPSGMVLLNNKIYVSGNAYSNANSTYFSFITRLDAVTGAKEWQYGYTDPDFPGALGFVDIALYDTLLMASSGAQGQTVTLINQQGEVKKSIKTKFASSYGPKVTRAGADNKGHIYMMQWTEESLNLQPYFWYATNFAEIDTTLKKYMGLVFAEYSRSYFNDAKMGADNKFGAVGERFGYVNDAVYASRDIRLLSVDTISSGEFCFYSDTSYEVSLKTINRLNFQYPIESSLSINIVDGTAYTVTDAFLQSRYTCPDFLDSCSFMKITGPVNLCSIADTYTYRMHRNKKCTLQPQWQLPAGATIINQTDSTLSLNFSGFGTYRLYASLKSCIPIKDSLVITITSKSHPLNLGPDTSICSGTTLQLHAAKDFFSYTWNDGSKDSVLSVTQPGLYWVETIDSCNNHLRDSINIDTFYFPISIGPDRRKCADDSIQLNGPSDFLNYEWSDLSNLSSFNTQNVIVNPTADAVYFLKAEKLAGCFSYDTVRVLINYAPPIHLGQDKSFCLGDSAVLDAGEGFVQYLWSNNSLTRQISVYAKGTYIVTAITAEGCKSADTLKVVEVWPNPELSLYKNNYLCNGAEITLQPGNYAFYKWQDGSTSSSFTVSQTGLYHLTVTDNNQCIGTDTVNIIYIKPLPANFLPADTAICNYGEITLAVNRAYQSYLWNSGETNASIKIKKPGLYSLEVKDNFGCTGSDSLTVISKDCLTGLYVPTAFSPNYDRLNDDFKPYLFGNILFYEFSVYNRFGQIVFSSRSQISGWDGTYKGNLQESGNYVWVCRYRLAGETEQVKRGSVLLLR